ncbi:MAG: CsbD family protein [Planctomycetaceae bacterium]
MNWDQIKGKWKQAKGELQTKWGKLTDDDFDVINGQREKLVGKVQERYGVAKEEAEKEVNDFERSCHVC